MMRPGGGSVVGYNVQTAVDSKHHAGVERLERRECPLLADSVEKLGFQRA